MVGTTSWICVSKPFHQRQWAKKEKGMINQMKHCERLFASILAVVLLVSIMALPASATTNWKSEISNFKPVSEYYANLYPKYLWALQRFLFSYPDTADEMQGSTHDGIWGSRTRAAVLEFQRLMGLGQDAIVGTNTWTAVANCLQATSEVWDGQTHNCARIIGTGTPVFMIKLDCSAYYYFYGDWPATPKFHPYSA